MAKVTRKGKARAGASRKTKARAGGKLKAPADLRTMITVAAWADPKFAELVQRDPAAAVAELAKEYDIKPPRGMKFKTVQADPNEYLFFLPPNPAGELKTSRLEAGPGGIRTVTADCWCGDTTTGRCSCGSIAGTPCLGCRTSTSRCFCN
ncbi:MAG: hypothetical protein HYX37_16685 [Rhizobiales bacterium]|jgi:hypothetical protein|nr:hypothetical protein [Hyphomicrobiales bacterium]